MRFLKLSCAVLIFACAQAFASGGGGDAAPADGAAAGPLPKDQKEYIEKSSKLNSLMNRIAEQEKQFKELVHHKNEAKSTAAKQTIIHEMVTLSNQRNKDVDTYNKLKSDLELRYPNVGSSRVDLQACKLEYSIVSPK